MTGPLILIVLGVLFLLNNLYPEVYPFGRVWPVILIVIGVAKVLESIARRRSDSGVPPPKAASPGNPEGGPDAEEKESE